MRGGSLPGERRGGRKKGTPNKLTAAQREAARKSGLAPLDFMLQVLRDEKQELSVRLDAARWAAPFCHARLSAVDVSNRDGVPFVINIKRFSEADDDGRAR